MAPRYVPISGGMQTIPAREMDLRGPTLKAAQQNSNAVAGQTVENVGDRNADAAAAEYGMFVNQERQAHSRQLAAEQAAAERDEELYQRQQDFDQSVKALSKASLDPDRFWSSRSTGQKVSGIIGVALGGFLQGARGGPNPALEMINTAIERDIKAQEFGYAAAREGAQAKQNAFSLAMQKYNSVDVARSLARAAALDAVQAQFGQQKALYAGTEAANRADMAMAQLEQDKTNQIAQGIRFIPQAQAAGERKFYDRRFGTVLTNNQMLARGDKIEDREHGLATIGVQGEVDLTKGVTLEEVKARVAGQKDQRGLQVALPNGDVVKAPNEGEATKLRELAVSMQTAKDLAKEAKAIRENSTFRATPEARARLKQIQANMVTAFGVQNKLGALSDADMQLAVDGTANLFDFGSGVDARLDRTMQQSDAAVRRYVRTFADAPGTAKGEMPASFKAAGKK